MKEFWVEFNWEEVCGRNLPNNIRMFKSEAEANEFAKTTVDGKVVEVAMIKC